MRLIGGRLAMVMTISRGLCFVGVPRRLPWPRRSLVAVPEAVIGESHDISEAAAAAAAAVAPPSVAGAGLVARARRRVPERDKKAVAYRQQYACARCECVLPPDYEVDHITPLALGGANGLANLQALCAPCHAQKTRDQRHAILAARKPPPQQQQLPAADGDAADAVAGAASEGGAASTPQPGMEVETGVAPMAAGEAQEGAHDRRGESPAVSPSPPPRPSPSPSPPSPLPPPPSSQLLSPLQLLQGMNRQQLAAVLATRGPVRLSAGPGTGKTRVLVAHIAHLVRAA